jgi:hypothetical protein
MKGGIVHRRAVLGFGLAAAAALACSGCRSTYYGIMESVGIHKRDLLVERVESARDVQRKTAEVFALALARYTAVIGSPESSLSMAYAALSQDLERCERQARDVRDRVASVETVSRDLFKEWRKELKAYNDPALRARSEATLKATEARCRPLIASMKQAEARIEPALKPLRDQVLFLKHNLNAEVIAGLKTEAASVEAGVNALLADIRKAVADADAFIAGLGAET